MIIENRFTVNAPIQKAWDFLMNPESLSSCVPGCEKVEVIDDKTYFGIIKVKVGPISARFKIKTIITEITPPTYLTSTSQGEDIGKAGFVSQKNFLQLDELSQNMTEIWYKSEVSIVGRLATFGDRIIRAKAKELGDKFVNSLKSKLEGS